MDTLEQTVNETIKDQSISDETTNYLDFINKEIKNSLKDASKQIINTIELTSGNNTEEE